MISTLLGSALFTALSCFCLAMILMNWSLKSYTMLGRLAMTAVKALSPNIKSTVLRQSLWSDAEEQVLATIPSVCCYGNCLIISLC